MEMCVKHENEKLREYVYLIILLRLLLTVAWQPSSYMLSGRGEIFAHCTLLRE